MNVCCTYTKWHGFAAHRCNLDAVCLVRFFSQRDGERWLPRCKRHNEQRKKYNKPQVKPLEATT